MTKKRYGVDRKSLPEWLRGADPLDPDGAPFFNDKQLTMPLPKLWRKLLRRPGMLPDKHMIGGKGKPVKRGTMITAADTVECFMDGWGNPAFPGYQTIGEHAGFGTTPESAKSQAIRAIKALEELGWFNVTHVTGGRRVSNTYLLSIPNTDPRTVSPGHPLSPETVVTGHPLSDETVSHDRQTVASTPLTVSPGPSNGVPRTPEGLGSKYEVQEAGGASPTGDGAPPLTPDQQRQVQDRINRGWNPTDAEDYIREEAARQAKSSAA